MITKEFFKRKKVTVFGLGLNGGGVATVRFLAAHGAREIIVTDIKKRADLAPSLRLLEGIKNVTFVLGQHRPEDFSHTDMVILNPGIPWTNEYVRIALAHHIPVEMDASIFFQLCPCPIIGITGTKGKTTTASLLAHILEVAGNRVVRVGIGQVPVLDTLEKIHSKKSIVVFELSSWRLSSLKRCAISPHIAVFTNIFPDHLNYYKNMKGYVEDKNNIFAFQTKKDWLVVNRSNALAMDATRNAPSQRFDFSEDEVLNEEDESICIREQTIVYRRNGEVTTVMPLSDVKMKGSHNVSNILAAIGGAVAYGIDAETIRKGVTNFFGVEHRLERVREKDGVTYYNDTAATVPEATIAALSSFGDAPIILIAGGSMKGLDFSELSKVIASRTKEVIFLKGEASEKIIQALRQYAPSRYKEHVFCLEESMEDAVRLAAQKASSGDIVILSPGATSFGMFQNEFDRGKQFRNAVKALESFVIR